MEWRTQVCHAYTSLPLGPAQIDRTVLYTRPTVYLTISRPTSGQYTGFCLALCGNVRRRMRLHALPYAVLCVALCGPMRCPMRPHASPHAALCVDPNVHDTVIHHCIARVRHVLRSAKGRKQIHWPASPSRRKATNLFGRCADLILVFRFCYVG